MIYKMSVFEIWKFNYITSIWASVITSFCSATTITHFKGVYNYIFHIHTFLVNFIIVKSLVTLDFIWPKKSCMLFMFVAGL